MNSIVRISSASLLAVAVVLAVAACGQQPPAPPAGDATPAAQAPAPSRTYPAGLFEHPAAAGLPVGGNCSLDRVNKQPFGATPYAMGEELLFGGWLAPPKGVPTQRPLLVLDDGTRQFAHGFLTGGKRDDVATQLGRPELATAGFNVRVTLKGVAEGEYALWLAQEGPGGFRCNTKKSITVTR